MSNKKLYLVFSFVLAIFLGLAWSFSSAVFFNIDLWGVAPARPQYMKRNMTPIHFKDNWNDFWWFMYFANGLTATGDVSDQTYKVQMTVDDAVECMQMVKWFYYNAERGERLWPLDPNTAESWWMSLSFDGWFWLYTRCHGSGYNAKLSACAGSGSEKAIEDCQREVSDKYVDSHGYYWTLIHDYNWVKFGLIGWTNYNINTSNNSHKGVYPSTPLKPSFIRYDNKYPVWFVYDSNGWAGFVWCKILGNYSGGTVFAAYRNNGYDWNNLFKLNGAGTWIEAQPVLEWILECGDIGSAKNTLISVIVDGLVWITSAEKWETENGGIEWNQGNEKMQYFSSVDINNTKLINYARQKAEILCRWKWKNYVAEDEDINCVSGSVGELIVAPLNKTLIVKWWANVKVKNMTDFEDKYYDIFVDHGNLLIEDVEWDLKVFKKNWFIHDGIDVDDFWIQMNSVAEYTWEDVAAWRFIKWNFIVNGSVKPNPPSTWLDHVQFVYWRFTTLDSVEDLKSTFTRRCYIWTGSDNTPCPMSLQGGVRENPYEWASLVIIDQNYPSPLYN